VQVHLAELLTAVINPLGGSGPASVDPNLNAEMSSEVSERVLPLKSTLGAQANRLEAQLVVPFPTAVLPAFR